MMRTVRDLDRYPRTLDSDIRNPLAQPSIVWATLPPGGQVSNGSCLPLRNVDPGGIIQYLEDQLGPRTGTCILGNNVIGVSGWENVALDLQLEAISSTAGAFVASNMLYLRVTGPDAAACLDSLTPRDILNLKNGHAAFVIFTTPVGTVDEEAIVIRLDDDDFLLSCGGGKEPSWLRQTLELHPNATLQYPDIVSFNLKGPRSRQAAKHLVSPECVGRIDGLERFRMCRIVTFNGESAWVLRTSVNTEFWGSAEIVKSLWEKIVTTPGIATPCGWDALNVFRVDCSKMVFGVYPIDVHCGTTLWEAGYAAMAAQQKESEFIGGNFLGNQRLKRRLWLGGLLATEGLSAPPVVGEEIYTAEGRFVGYITTSTYSAKFGRAAAFGHFGLEFQPGQTVFAGNEQWKLAKLPF